MTQNNKIKAFICIVFALSYYIIFGLTSIASGMIHERITLAFPFEAKIPFYPASSIIYLSINLLLFLALFILRGWQLLAAFAITLLIETFIAGICFIIIPIKLIYLPITTNSNLSAIVDTARFLSMNDNYFPSLHTAFALTALFTYKPYCSMPIRIFLSLWACSIPLSTLFLHEHQIGDLIAGSILAMVAYLFIFQKLQFAFVDKKTVNELNNPISSLSIMK